ncbi:hypothetical protein H5410_053617 [Solanum commersonii]|uniref:Uncharacterized protein n=1 Tax=Solanum commersonii TaxID=4109 RepID=A0A9J5X6X7_SOLCO|nr:hypothetical protein H5410_053617 [Solanum commersonii]
MQKQENQVNQPPLGILFALCCYAGYVKFVLTKPLGGYDSSKGINLCLSIQLVMQYVLLYVILHFGPLIM